MPLSVFYFYQNKNQNSDFQNFSTLIIFIKMKKKILSALLLLSIFDVFAQGGGPCSQPISIKSVTIGNSTCGNKTGFLEVKVMGNQSDFTYAWMPNISADPSVVDLPAGTYHLRITRLSDPDCILDTALIVNNTNGPEFFLDSFIAPNCKATDGLLQLTPATGLNYTWSNGKTGAVNSSIPGGCYIATATLPATGCSSIYRFCLPTTNRLDTKYEVVKPAKCGQPTGEIKLTTSGGYGSYTYSVSGGPVLTGLPKGNGTCIITDDISACKDTVNFIVPEGFPEADVNANIGPVKCPGGSDGFIFAAVTPVKNFSWPPSFALFNAAGDPMPGLAGLKTGFYTLVVADADNCVLPPYSFFLPDPPAFAVVPSVTSADCLQGGQIDLQITGGNGNGPYFVDWNDLPGEQNGTDRLHLQPGLYSATIYDTLFCSIKLDTLTVPTLCNLPRTLYRSVEINQTDTFCLSTPVGLNPTQVKFLLEKGGTAGTSAYGAWALTAEGCLIYSAFGTAGYAVDTVCIRIDAGVSGLSSSVCFVISISAQAPSVANIFFTVQAGLSATVCGPIPANFNSPQINLLDNIGLSGTSGSFGTYAVNDSTACLTFQAAQQSGFNVDEICVSVYDPALKLAHTICYYPTILPMVDCSKYQHFQDSLTAPTTNCDLPTDVCVPIPFQEIFNYAILDNGLPYAGGLSGCNYDTLFGYSLASISGGGPYVLNSWVVNNQVHGGSFPTLDFLPTLLNQIDTSGKWTLMGGALLGGNPNNNYGLIIVTTPQGVKVLSPGQQVVPQNAQMALSVGSHQIVLRHILTGCVDTAFVEVLCYECPPLLDYPVNTAGDIVWTTERCQTDTLFCTKILGADLSDYTVLVNGVPPAEFSPCGEYVGFRLDTGYHSIYLRNNNTTCEYLADFFFRCEKLLDSDTITVPLVVAEQKIVCPDISKIPGTVVSFANACPDGSDGNAAWSLDLSTNCALLTGNSPGIDTLCLRICNAEGYCALTIVIVKVQAEKDSLVARPDMANTLRDRAINLSILSNDLYIPPVTASIVVPPTLGKADFDPATGILVYTPDTGKCGSDSLLYRITDSEGRSSQAWVNIKISCDKILVFNGISPNEDGANDTWTIAGIEQYPDNTVRVFNRWGNLVFERQGYTNADPWAGRWLDRDLPDGTYFYIIDLGGNVGKVSGYLQISR